MICCVLIYFCFAFSPFIQKLATAFSDWIIYMLDSSAIFYFRYLLALCWKTSSHYCKQYNLLQLTVKLFFSLLGGCSEVTNAIRQIYCYSSGIKSLETSASVWDHHFLFRTFKSPKKDRKIVWNFKILAFVTQNNAVKRNR